MDKLVSNYLSSRVIIAPQQFENLIMVPILGPVADGPKYLTLHHAVAQGLVSIEEISQGGSVPELRVTNNADLPVLLLDGDELVGAKQNRVVNTSILVPEKTTMTVPVSCTESGRWQYRRGANFTPGDHSHTVALRRTKSEGVSFYLRSDSSFRSEQHEVWDEIKRQSAKAGIHSRTNAMYDVFEGRRSGLNDYAAAFPRVEGQTGFIALVNGKVAGMDILSSAEAYADVHDRLIRGYAMDALIHRGESEPEAKGVDAFARAEKFIQEATTLREARYESVGYGYDHRFSGASALGSALVHENTVVHLCLFAAIEKAYDDAPDSGPLY